MAMEATIFTGWIYDYLLPHADFQAEEQAHPARAGGSRQAGAPIFPRTGPAPGQGNAAREQESGHAGGSQETGGLHARGGPQETGLRAGRRVGGQSSGLKNPS